MLLHQTLKRWKKRSLHDEVQVAMVNQPVHGQSNDENHRENSVHKVVNKPVHDDSNLYERALDMNYAQQVHNVNKFGEHTSGTAVILIQVHDRAVFFTHLIDSLRVVRGIEKATIVISMDKFSTEINDIIATIDFCRYITIFFPFAMQLFPSSFPGEDPNDCSRDISRTEAIARKCNNAEYPDSYGHYREVRYVQIKHHWLWKLHMVFSGMKVLAEGKSPVLLLEEDYYVFPDILHCLELGIAFRESKCPRCDLISLGNYEPRQDYSTLANHVDFNAWTSTKSNMGMVITKQFYDKLAACTDMICDFDDYNWDWSLQAASLSCMSGGVFTVQFKASRVYHFGTCSGMHNSANCNVDDHMRNVKSKLNSANLFPTSLHVTADDPKPAINPRPNGGWGDLRDRTLCKKYKTLCESALKS
ncbi:unnamed protein product [Clavelina lepadiformis]|uniref:Alpha-1,6-mannosyl-glycoprotein 2-beta-N-acetylglucosaminyltransferase n=1 Tax=Clavelina lepadiformis TaxID=159417 RepID=A0ABP0GNH6_CLALP